MSNEDDKTIKRFIIIMLIVLAFCVGMYFATKYLVDKDNTTEEETTNEVQINNDVAIVGTMLNKNDSEYFVLLYNKKDDKAYEYQSLVSSNKTKLNIYTVDLGNGLNSKYYDKDNTNTKADNINDLRFGDITLIKVKEGKIINSYESLETIKSVLS